MPANKPKPAKAKKSQDPKDPLAYDHTKGEGKLLLRPDVGLQAQFNVSAIPEQPFEEPVRLPIEDVLDLHTFAPKEVASVVEEYLAQCREKGLAEVRLIHGKGTGTQKAIVRRLLMNHPDILSFADAPLEAGGWGATVVRLK